MVVAVIGLTSSDDGGPGPLALPGLDAPDASSRACSGLLDKLPDSFKSGDEELERRELADPAPRGAAAWGEQSPVVLRCGLPRPPQLKKTSQLREINGVSWLPVEGEVSQTWYAVDRDVYVALTISGGSGTGPLQSVSDVIADELPAR